MYYTKLKPNEKIKYHYFFKSTVTVELFVYPIYVWVRTVFATFFVNLLMFTTSHLATLRKFLKLIFPDPSSSNRLKAFKISCCGSRSNIISVTVKPNKENVHNVPSLQK